MKRLLELIQPCDFELRTGIPTERAGIVRCLGCNSDVHDLSAMTAAKALEFLARRRPDQCVRFSSDEDDQIHFADGASGFVGRIARDAKPMISVASLILAACGGEADIERADTSASTVIAAETATTSAPLPPPSVTQAVLPSPSASASGSCQPLASGSTSARPVAARPAHNPVDQKRRQLAGYP